MSSLIFLFVFALGAIIGSFLNVVILRYNTGSDLSGRSHCFSCGKTLEWYELIPILSFLFLRGKCSRCKSSISLQYPLVELVSGLIFVFFFWREIYALDAALMVPIVGSILSIIIWEILLVIFVYDLKHQIIPDLFSYLFIGFSFLSFLLEWFTLGGETHELLYRILAGFALFLFFFILWYLSWGRWVGFGDAKLAFGIGLYLGIAKGLSALAFAFWIGAAVGVVIMSIQRMSLGGGEGKLNLKRKMLTMKSAIPFAPFLILGTFLALLLQSDLFGIQFFL